MMNSPAEIANNYVPIGKGKTTMKASKLFILGIYSLRQHRVCIRSETGRRVRVPGRSYFSHLGG